MDKNNAIKTSDTNITLRSDMLDLLSPNLTPIQIEDSIKNNLNYQLNSNGYRCDYFQKTHDGLHLLFTGCSNTFGEGVVQDKTWTSLLHKEISKNQKVSGYYNLAICGSTIFEIIKNCYRYIRRYGAPDYIFMLLPEIERDHIYFKESRQLLVSHIVEIYKMFEDFCNAKNIKLISTTWVMDGESWWENMENINTMPHKHGQHYQKDSFYNEFAGLSPYEGLKKIEEKTKTFTALSIDDTRHDIFKFAQNNKNDEHLYIAPDRNKHYGHAFHYAWYKFFYRKYSDEKNNL
jgi:hypothetical protein